MNAWTPQDDAVKFTNDEIRGEIRHRSNWIILFRQLTLLSEHRCVGLVVGILTNSSLPNEVLFIKIMSFRRFFFSLVTHFNFLYVFFFGLLNRMVDDSGSDDDDSAASSAIQIFLWFWTFKECNNITQFHLAIFRLVCGVRGVYFIRYNSEYSNALNLFASFSLETESFSNR